MAVEKRTLVLFHYSLECPLPLFSFSSLSSLSIAAPDHNYNLACYKYEVERLTGERVEDLFIYFTDTGFLLRSDLEIRAEEVVLELSGKIKEYSRLKPLPEDITCTNTEMCRFCGYQEFCKK